MILLENPFDYVKVFLGGLGISFTPCVYPLVPVIIGYIGITPESSRWKGFRLSLTYVTGVALTYSFLGLIASLTGMIFGMVSSHPITYFFVGIMIIVFGLSMLNIITLPIFGPKDIVRRDKKDYFSIFLLGLTSGLIVGPCTAPALGSILLYLGTKKNILYGMSLLLTFGYGMGLILILSGTFGGFLLRLPQSGPWLNRVQKLCAWILVGAGIFFIVVGIRRL